MASPRPPGAPLQDWLAPLGLGLLVLLLSATFVGHRPFQGWVVTWDMFVPERASMDFPLRYFPWLHVSSTDPQVQGRFVPVAPFLPVARVGWPLNGLEHDRSAQLVQLGLLLVGLWLCWAQLRPAGDRWQVAGVLARRLWLTLGLCGFYAYFNFGHLHFSNFVHIWDTYHYYFGAKYFPELGYDLLYDCAAVVDSQSGRREEALARKHTDLRTNQVVPVSQALEHPERCTQAFTPERFQAFSEDVNLFRSWVSAERWKEMNLDHGYNATPVWTLAGYALTNLAPRLEGLLEPSLPGYQAAATAARQGQFGLAQQLVAEVQARTGEPLRNLGARHVVLLNLVDPLLLALSLALVLWAFGPEAFGLAGLLLGCNFASRFYWTGGAFLRHDWLFFLVAQVCLLRKGFPGLAGAALAYSTLLRLFPGVTLLGPALAAVEGFRRTRTLDRALLRYAAGGVVASALLLGTSWVVVGGGSTWQRFAQNTWKHASTPLTNHMGLRTLLSWRYNTTGAFLSDRSAVDPWARWKATRLEKFDELRPLFYLALLAAAALLYLALRDSGPEPWVAAALGIGFIPFAAELTNYYYCFLVGMAGLVLVRKDVAPVLLTLAALTMFLELGPLPYMPRNLDEKYVAMSVVALVCVLGLWVSFTRWAEQPGLVTSPSPDSGTPEARGPRKRRAR